MSVRQQLHAIRSWPICASALLALVLAGACGGESTQGGPGASSRAFPVETTNATAPEGPAYVRVPAIIEPYEVVTITARVAGVIEEMHFVDGDRVRAGASLARIDSQRLALEEKSARADYAQAQVAQQDAQAALARRETIERQQPGVLSSEELSSARTHAAQADANLAKAQATLATRSLASQWSRVPAPQSGTLQRRLVTTGQYVQVGTPIATLVQREPMLLQFEVGSEIAARIEHGARLHAQTASGLALTAEVIFVGDVALEGSRQIPVTARIQNPAREMRTIRGGESADVNVAIVLPAQSVLIPDTAVRPTDKGYRTYVVQGQDAKPRVIRLGARMDDGRVEVVEGLTANEIVVIRGAEALKSGATVRVTVGPGADGQPSAQPTTLSTP